MNQTQERHPSSQRFHNLLTEIGALHDRKQSDYGTDKDPFHNVRVSAEWGFPSWVGALMRGCDKVSRLKTYAKRGKLANESVRDAFLDLAVYSLIGLVLWEDEQRAKLQRAFDEDRAAWDAALESRNATAEPQRTLEPAERTVIRKFCPICHRSKPCRIHGRGIA